MSHIRRGGTATFGLSVLVTIAVTASMLLFVGGSSATSATSDGTGAARSSFTRIAHSPQGSARSKIVGTAANGHRVTGYFTPTGFTKHNGHLRVRGLVSGVIHRGDGTSKTFSAMRTLRVKSMNGMTP